MARHGGRRGWWNRQLLPQIDLVGADRGPVARQICFAGSIKWLGTPFDDHDLADLSRDAVQIPGFDPGRTGLVVVSRSGTSVSRGQVDLLWGPDDLVSAWRAG